MSEKLIERLKKSIFTTKEARAQGVSPRMLSYFVKAGHLKRVSHGVYEKEGIETSFDFTSIVKRILTEVPQGVLGRLSALKFYGLIDEDPREVEVVVPTDNFPKRHVEDARFFRAPRDSFNWGIEKKSGLKVTSLERTLIECLKTNVSMKLVRTAFEEAQRKGLKPSLGQMARFSKLFRTQAKFQSFREAIL